MQTELCHSWKITLNEAKELQKSLEKEIKICQMPDTIHQVAGFDISYLKEKNRLIAGMVILGYPTLDLIDSFIITDHIRFPYIPGYLSFREAPVLLRLIESHYKLADIFVFDGHGIAHPRGFGIASHIGVLTDLPCIGCAKKKLVGNFVSPGDQKGDITDLIYKERVVGKVLRTRNNIKPVFVSIGHRVSLNGATKFILDCTGKYRLPEPTRLAHRLVTAYRKKLVNSRS